MSRVLELAQQLIRCQSITPNDNGCQDILMQRLQQMDFVIEKLPFADVSNFWARRGNAEPLLVFVGHTDVVPPGPLEQWTSPPFEPTVKDGYLYGRGAADMKSSLAAMLVACEDFIAKFPQHQGSIAWLITSDEEGPSINGTQKVVEYLKQQNIKIDYCLVGEASSQEKLGDTLKIGRRGTLSGTLTIHGKQGHIAYPQIADNPIHRFTTALSKLINEKWDNGNEYFQPTSLQFSNIHSGTGAGNVIPGILEAKFNFRYSPEITATQLQQRTETILQKHQLHYSLTWQHSGEPFLTKPGKLVDACTKAVQTSADFSPELSTTGGTSDGRFLAPLGCEVVELGPCNRTIHQINECISITELNELTKIYSSLLQELLT